MTKLLVWNRRPGQGARAGRRGSGARPRRDLETAVQEADIVCCATSSTSPLVRGAWLKPGAHLDLVGGFTPEMRECDDAAVLRARLFVD